MVPIGKTTSRKKKTRTTKGRKLTRSSHFKNQQLESKKQETSSENKDRNMDSDKVVEDVSVPPTSKSICSTPKGQKFRIPEISTCPPAPKKQRQRVLSNFSLRRTFFAPPDLEMFLCVALQDSPVSIFC
ncbi:cyclin-dependent protein kinase inhibitor SMR13-like [Vicia villosa]|uniref:cyclin-dependent protein kinase inhibitor SMR13-like n=1 Tax=Vicia villosa TaxID=3911 RepID=UPI00273AD2E3|nr:cyclin-dependent protein kinase inhibitor SMR13-like [Vicia villosa]